MSKPYDPDAYAHIVRKGLFDQIRCDDAHAVLVSILMWMVRTSDKVTERTVKTMRENNWSEDDVQLFETFMKALKDEDDGTIQ